MGRPFITAAVMVCAVVCTEYADAQVRKLSDADLDKVTAGGAPAPQRPPTEVTAGSQEFEVSGAAGTRHTVAGTGSVQLVQQEKPAPGASLVISDAAQQNLQSFINIAAVNSRIQVLVNLNIIINSTLGTLQQLNVSAPVSGP